MEEAKSQADDTTRRHTSSSSSYAWMVLFASFMICVLVSGHEVILSIFMVEFLHHFSVSTSTITWIGAVNSCLGELAGFAMSPLMRMTSPRLLCMGGGLLSVFGYVISGIWPSLPVIYVFFGAVTSVGRAALFMSGMVVVQQYFTKRRALAHSIYTSGFSVGYFTLPSLVRIIISEYGWSQALIVVSGIILQSQIFALLMRPLPKMQRDDDGYLNTSDTKSSNIKQIQHTSSDSNLWGRVPLILFLISVFGIHIGQLVNIIYLPLRCDMINLSKTEASNLLTIIGVTGMFFRPALGHLGDQLWMNRVVMFGAASVLTGVLTGVTSLVYSFPGLIVTAVLFSFFSAGYCSLTGAIIAETGGSLPLEFTTGLFTTVTGLSNLVVNVGSGYMVDFTGDINVPFIVFGCLQATGGLLMFTIPVIKKYRVVPEQHHKIPPSH